MVNLKINNIEITVPEGTLILDAAKQLNINIPTLCYHEDLCIAGNCRVCVVEQKGSKSLVASCATAATEGMEIHTNTLQVRQARKDIIELLLSEHAGDCTKCQKNGVLRTSEPCKRIHVRKSAISRCLPKASRGQIKSFYSKG